MTHRDERNVTSMDDRDLVISALVKLVKQEFPVDDDDPDSDLAFWAERCATDEELAALRRTFRRT